MNKQVAIAAFVATAAAQVATPCDGPFVDAAKAKLSEMEFAKTDLEAMTAGLTAEATAAAAVKTTAAGRVTAQQAILTAVQADATTRASAWQAKVDAVAAATAQITTIDAALTTAEAARVAAVALVTAQDLLITNQNAEIAKMQKTLDDSTTELAEMNTALTTATATKNTAIAAKTAADTAVTTWQASLGGLGVATTNAATALSNYTPLATAKTTADTNLTNEATYKPAKAANQLGVETLRILAVGCPSNCQANVDDPQTVIWQTQKTANEGTLTSNLTTPQSTWNGLVTAASTAQKNEVESANIKAVRDTELVTAQGVETTLLATQTTAGSTVTTTTAAETTATTNRDAVQGHVTQATADLARQQALLTPLTAAKVTLDNDVVVKTYLKQVQTDLKAVQTAAKAAGNLNLQDALELKNSAEALVTRAQLALTFYTDLDTTAATAKTQADGLVTANTVAIAGATASITDATTKLAAAVAACKGKGYDQAMEALRLQMDTRAAEDIQIAAVTASYATASAFNTSGDMSANTVCAFPAKAKDAAQEPRPQCAKGFCCGAAQKFLKDGTKLAVETCQEETGVHTYEYYPPLPPRALVEPQPETWRFQCISGAQKLAAAATAALAASYMMA